MKIRINTKKLKALNPCEDRLDNWISNYDDFNGDIIKFLNLPNITAQDKIWVSVRLISREVLEIFAIDCAFSAEKYANAANAANAAAYAAANAAYTVDAAAYAAAYAADAAAAYAAYAAAAYAADAAAAYAAAAYAAERNNQIQALIYLIQNL